jgi:HEAT repeat protein
MSAPTLPDPEVEEAIAELRVIAREAVGHEVDPAFYALLDRREALYEQLMVHNSASLAPLIGLLSERNSMVSLFAAEALGRLGDVSAVKPLLEAFVAEANPVYSIAVAQIGDRSAVEPLIAILDNADALAEEHAEQIRLRGLAAQPRSLNAWLDRTLYRLGIVKTDRHIRDAQSLLLRRSAAQALEALGDPRALEPLRRWAEHPEPTLRETIQRAVQTLEYQTTERR